MGNTRVINTKTNTITVIDSDRLEEVLKDKDIELYKNKKIVKPAEKKDIEKEISKEVIAEERRVNFDF